MGGDDNGESTSGGFKIPVKVIMHPDLSTFYHCHEENLLLLSLNRIKWLLLVNPAASEKWMKKITKQNRTTRTWSTYHLYVVCSCFFGYFEPVQLCTCTCSYVWVSIKVNKIHAFKIINVKKTHVANQLSYIFWEKKKVGNSYWR